MADTAQKLHVRLYSPDKTHYEGDADKVHMETELGELELLPHHTSLMGSILFAPIHIYNDDEEHIFYARQGMLAVYNETNEVHILGLSVEKGDDIDHTTIEEYMNFILDTLKKDKDLSEIQTNFLEEQHASLERLVEVTKKNEQ